MGRNDNLDVGVRCCFIVRCAHALVIDHRPREGFKQNLQVQKRTPVVDVPDVELDPLLDAGVAAVAVHLRPTGDAGLHLMLHHVERDLFAELLNKVRKLRPRADQAHVTAEDVDQLRQLVKTCLTDERTEFRATAVTLFAPCRIGLVVHAHGTELQHRKPLPVVTYSLLSKEDRSGARELHADCQYDHQRAQKDKTQEAD